MYFPSNCNFREFVTFFTKKNSSNSGKSFFAMAAKKKCDFIAIFYGGSIHKNCNRITSFLGRHRKNDLPPIDEFIFFFFCEKSYKFAKIEI